MLSVRLDPELEKRLDLLAEITGRSKSYYVRQLLEEHIEDLEDRYIAEHRLENRQPSLTSQEVRETLGLDH